MNEEEVFFNFEDDRDWNSRLSVNSSPTRSLTRSIDDDCFSLPFEPDETEDRDKATSPSDHETILRAMDDLLSGSGTSEMDPFQLDVPINPDTAITTSSSTNMDDTDTFVVPQIPPWRLNKSDNYGTLLTHSPSHQKLPEKLDGPVTKTWTDYTDETLVGRRIPSRKLTEPETHHKKETAVTNSSLADVVFEKPLVDPWEPSLLTDQNNLRDYAVNFVSPTCFVNTASPITYRDSSLVLDEPNTHDTDGISYEVTAGLDFDVEKTSVPWSSTSFQPNRKKIQDAVDYCNHAADFTPDYGDDVLWEPDRPLCHNNNRIVTDTECNNEMDISTTPAISLTTSPILTKKSSSQFDKSDKRDSNGIAAFSTISLIDSPILAHNMSFQPNDSHNQATGFATTVPSVFTPTEPPVYDKQPSCQSNVRKHHFADTMPIEYVSRTKYPLVSPNGVNPNETLKEVALRYITSSAESSQSLHKVQNIRKQPVDTEPNPVPKKKRASRVEKLAKNDPRIWRWILMPKRTYMLPIDIQRPPLSYMTLACLAVQNSPTRYVTLPEAYSFVLHHFRYYRYIPDFWKHSMRLCLTRRMFKVRQVVGKKERSYGREEEFNWTTIFRREEQKYMDSQDTRGREFFNKMRRGELGLPRQLFYNVIALQMPVFAGPENSALFYHLLGTKYVPTRFVPLFREYWLYEHSGNEPKFVEKPYQTDYRHSLSIGVHNSFGEALDFGEKPKMMTVEQVVSFHDNVEAYFTLQKKYEKQGILTWKTPKSREVDRVVIGGGAKSEYCLPRAVEYLPPGSVYENVGMSLPPQYEELFAGNAGKDEDTEEIPLPINEKKVSANTLQPTWFVVGKTRQKKVKKRPIDRKQKALEACTTNCSDLYRDLVEQDSPIVAKMIRLEETSEHLEHGDSSNSSEDDWVLFGKESFGVETRIQMNQSSDPSSISLFECVI